MPLAHPVPPPLEKLSCPKAHCLVALLFLQGCLYTHVLRCAAHASVCRCVGGAICACAGFVAPEERNETPTVPSNIPIHTPLSNPETPCPQVSYRYTTRRGLSTKVINVFDCELPPTQCPPAHDIYGIHFHFFFISDFIVRCHLMWKELPVWSGQPASQQTTASKKKTSRNSTKPGCNVSPFSQKYAMLQYARLPRWYEEMVGLNPCGFLQK